MEFTRLGQSPLRISRLALGGMSFHSLAEGRPVLHAALDAGITFFDTADLYDHGLNEQIVGQLLSKQRQEVVIATKVGNRWRADGSGWDWVPRKDYILKAVEKSLQRLKTDYIDLYQLHGGTIEDPLEEVVEAFEQLQQQGKIRAYGISSIRPNTVRKWTEVSQAASCMSQYSILDRRPEEFLLDHLHAAGQGVLVRGALAKGLLAGKPEKKYLDHSASQVATVQANLRQLVAEEELPGLALQYCLQHPAVASVVVGASSAAQIEQSVAAWQRVKELDIDYEMIANSVPVYHYQAHR